MTMYRDTCFAALAEHLADDVVVSTYSSAFEWTAIRPHPLNYVSVGAMGLASSHGLGLAIGAPARRIVVLDGDGSLLMNLGTLVSVAATAPRNLVHFVCENGTYEANGAHPLPGAGTVDFSGMARSAGYRHAETFDDIDKFKSRIGAFLELEGPVFGTLKLQPGAKAPVADYQYIHGQKARDDFRDALNRG